jgi:NADPH2:quinone reductase
MAQMKAVQIHRFGAEDVMQLDEVPVPAPGPREILIKMHATSVNHSDLFIRQNGNIHIGKQDLPLILGRELSGVVAEVGSNVKEYAPGQRVVALPAVQTRAAGLPGGKEYTACYAEYVLARPQDTRPLPDGIDFPQGVSAAWVGLTAAHSLGAGKLKAGETVLIPSGNSGVGMMAVQMAKNIGAKVFSTAGSDEKCRRVLELGADAAINHQTQDFEKETMKLTGGRGVDLVLDLIGGEGFVRALNVLAPAGRLIALGALSGGATALVKEPPPGRTAARFSITATLMEDPHAVEKLDELFALMLSGKMKVIVDRVFPLKDAPAAHRYIAERRNFGKVVLIP